MHSVSGRYLTKVKDAHGLMLIVWSMAKDFYLLKITGKVTEVGLQTPAISREFLASNSDLRIWFILIKESKIEIWHKGREGFEIIASIEPDLYVVAYETDHFAEEFYEWLLAARMRDMLDRIVLIAPENMLSIFRKRMPTDLLACVLAEIPKDLLALSTDERRHALENMILA